MSSTKNAKNTTGTPQTQGSKQGGGAPCNSFTLDTAVATPDGDKPIAEIEIGNTVLAYNEATGATDVYTVTHTMAHVDPQVVLLTDPHNYPRASVPDQGTWVGQCRGFAQRRCGAAGGR